MKSRGIVASFLLAFVSVFLVTGVQASTISNPIIWADIPDISIVQVADKYYMASTTMHMNPGVPIMESSDLVNWKTVGYAYTTLVSNDALNLANGSNAYGQGSWAASIRYKNGTFYVLVPGKSSGKTHLFSTTNLASGPWKEVQFPFYHDPSLLLDDDGRNYIVYGSGDLRIVELAADLSGVKAGGLNAVLISNATAASGSTTGLAAEGAHIEKINGYYYVFSICWPSGSMRTELVFRSSTLTGSYTGKIALQNQGVAQGSVIQAPDGTWYGYLFQDNGSVGRSPWLIPVVWQNDWPVFGTNGVAPSTISMNTAVPPDGYGMVVSDDFSATKLPLEWQWNHNPVNSDWSLTAKPGFMRITTSRTDADYLQVRNSLTQRAYGPKSSAQVAIETSGMKDGDFAGLGALQQKYGLVGVKVSGTTQSIVMVNASSGTATEVASVVITQKRVYVRIDMDFQSKTDIATFYYSTDGTTWQAIGNTLQMAYTIPHFMGYRFALFNYATKSSGGYADFDYFKIGKAYNNVLPFASSSSSSSSGTPLSSSSSTASSSSAVPQGPYSSMAVIPGTIQVENYDVGGEGVAYHDVDSINSGSVYRTDGVDITGDATSGYMLGWTQSGEWLEYSVQVDSSATYNWEARVSSGADNAAFSMLFDGILLSDTVAISNTGDWATYTTVTGTTPVLTAGQHILRLVVDGSYFNIDWIKFQSELPIPVRIIQKARTNPTIKAIRYDLLGRKSQGIHSKL